jgi:hypothetical protein
MTKSNDKQEAAAKLNELVEAFIEKVKSVSKP